jgi:hypothetical protein
MRAEPSPRAALIASAKCAGGLRRPPALPRPAHAGKARHMSLTPETIGAAAPKNCGPNLRYDYSNKT